jgi:acyl dehydratase
VRSFGCRRRPDPAPELAHRTPARPAARKAPGLSRIEPAGGFTAGVSTMNEDPRSRAKKIPKGNHYEDFELGRVFEHHWGRTINDGDNSLFSTLTMSFNPLYFNAEYARANGHRATVVNPMLVFLVVFGLSVEDLSETGGLFLGVDALTFHRPVYPGETLTARSTVVDRRESSSRPANGIVTWHTEGLNQRGEMVIDFRRTNLVNKRSAAR